MQVRLLSLAVVLLATVPVASGHGEHEADCDRRGDAWNHLGLWEPDLAPGDAAERTLGFEGCPLEEGWRLLLRADVEGELEVTLSQSGETLGSWTWSGPERFEVVTLPHTDFLSLRVERAAGADGNASARVYFDQTCLCALKGTHLVPGPVWMNALADAGDTVSFNVTLAPTSHPALPELPETIRVRAVLPGHHEATREWTFHPDREPSCREAGSWTACFEYAFEAPSDGRQDVLLWLDHDSDEAWSLSVRPVIEVQAADQGAPGLGVAAGAAVLAVAALLRRR